MRATYYVRGADSQVRSDNEYFTNIVEIRTSAVTQHKGWQSVSYEGRRYQLYGGIRTPNWISLDNPIPTRRSKV